MKGSALKWTFGAIVAFGVFGDLSMIGPKWILGLVIVILLGGRSMSKTAKAEADHEDDGKATGDTFMLGAIVVAFLLLVWYGMSFISFDPSPSPRPRIMNPKAGEPVAPWPNSRSKGFGVPMEDYKNMEDWTE